MSDAIELNAARLVAGAQRYASYDRSDPFCLDRCMCHIRQGLCRAIGDTEGLPWHWTETDDKGNKRAQRTQIKGAQGGPGHYDAIVVSTMDDGQVVMSHRDLRRP
jgi:hypothetical protein